MGWETQLKLWNLSSFWTLGGLNQPNLQVVETCQRVKIATPCVTYLTNTLATYPGYLGTPCARGGVRHLCTRLAIGRAQLLSQHEFQEKGWGTHTCKSTNYLPSQ